MRWRIRELFRWLRWLWGGKPMVKYEGYHCGCCGCWVNGAFEKPEYDLSGLFGNGWIGLCPEGTGCWVKEWDPLFDLDVI